MANLNENTAQAFKKYVNYSNDRNLALLFTEITSYSFKCVDLEKLRFLLFNTESCIWRPTAGEELRIFVQDEFIEWADNLDLKDVNGTVNKMEQKAVDKLINSVSSTTSACTLIKNLAVRHQVVYEEVFDWNCDTLQFKNGCLELKTGAFRKRIREDYVTAVMDYNYNAEVDAMVEGDLETLIKHIANDDDNIMGWIMSSLAYMCTGRTELQQFFNFYGPQAGNGKTTLFDMLSAAFPIHVVKFGKETFNKGYGQFKKQMARVGPLTRCTIIEEPDEAVMDMGMIKDVTSGGCIIVEVMYGNTRSITIRFKMTFITNHLLKFPYCNGGKRRGEGNEFLNKFVHSSKLASTKKSYKDGNVYAADLNIKNKFHDVRYKNALIKLLLPWFKFFYENHALYNQEKHQKVWEDSAEVNNVFGTFLEDIFVQTDDETDKLGKSEMMEMYRTYHKCKISDAKFFSYLKQNSLKYAKDTRVNGHKGAILGLRVRTDEENEIEEFGQYKDEIRKLQKRITELESQIENGDGSELADLIDEL